MVPSQLLYFCTSLGSPNRVSSSRLSESRCWFLQPWQSRRCSAPTAAGHEALRNLLRPPWEPQGCNDTCWCGERVTDVDVINACATHWWPVSDTLVAGVCGGAGLSHCSSRWAPPQESDTFPEGSFLQRSVSEHGDVQKSLVLRKLQILQNYFLSEIIVQSHIHYSPFFLSKLTYEFSWFGLVFGLIWGFFVCSLVLACCFVVWGFVCLFVFNFLVFWAGKWAVGKLCIT